ncbi:MAG: hypothetical protein UW27_C0001G0068 [Parcubacteria group bacterium GW2011_GWA1_44_13]|uniref:Uncharacterized protein n=1 Tax=Candidatus Nomurabacteria bacterium GW2011_GWB1_44_12 TaxID=1618748 RepID=A0A837I7Y2_9BACT|nr:MAG: hypothetical protein UW25_C0001G0069 [Candidatus Nomurabacteria bacterium GW2011_GWB1_44_12]KKT38572.1 MAG: hypothetical protein UW27_C0001G0068 [Parcubacteria group bacterium GW2011_GWA1_44_13]
MPVLQLRRSLAERGFRPQAQLNYTKIEKNSNNMW